MRNDLLRVSARLASLTDTLSDSEFHRLPGLYVEHLDRRIPERCFKLSGCAIDERISSVVNRYHLLGLDQFTHGVSGAFGIHRVVAPDADQRQVGMIELVNQSHVTEDRRVTGVVDLESVFELDDISCCRTSVVVSRPFGSYIETESE
jgi:hypothetical protein